MNDKQIEMLIGELSDIRAENAVIRYCLVELLGGVKNDCDEKHFIDHMKRLQVGVANQLEDGIRKSLGKPPMPVPRKVLIDHEFPDFFENYDWGNAKNN